MPIPVPLLSALGLGADATEAEAVEAAGKLKGDLESARNRADQPPDLAKWVPKAEHEAALNRAAAAEQAAKDREQAEFEKARDAALENVPPARREELKALCRSAEDLPHIQAIAKTYGELLTGETGAKTSPPGNMGTALNHEEAAVCKALGITAEQFAKARKAEQEENE